MAQTIIRDFVIELDERLRLPEPIVEFGSRRWNDTDPSVRPHFAGREYIGTDMLEGPGVDRVEDLRALSFADGEVGTALCLDTLEHCADPPAACRELARVVGDGGVCVIASVMLFGIHAYPEDYFRFTPEGFRALLDGFDDAWVAGVGPEAMPIQVIGVGAKGRELGLSFEQFPSLEAGQRAFDDDTGRVRVGLFAYEPRELAGALARATPRLVREKLRRR